jgi:hypothetical protein
MKPRLPLLITLIAFALAACGRDDEEPARGKDVAVQKSPDGRFTATIRMADVDGSVMVSQWYQVVLQNVHGVEHETSVMLVADKTDGLTIHWRSPDVLVVCYADAHIYNFRNTFTFAPEGAPGIQEAEVVLTKRSSLGECNRKENAA